MAMLEIVARGKTISLTVEQAASLIDSLCDLERTMVDVIKKQEPSRTSIGTVLSLAQRRMSEAGIELYPGSKEW